MRTLGVCERARETFCVSIMRGVCLCVSGWCVCVCVACVYVFKLHGRSMPVLLVLHSSQIKFMLLLLFLCQNSYIAYLVKNIKS